MPSSRVFEHPYYPIIYVRGYAATQGEIEETVADPYMGFNAGSTKIRQAWTGQIERMYFESPLIRLMKEYGYADVYEGGGEFPVDRELHPRCIIIYRYYDGASKDLGQGQRGEMEQYAIGLGQVIASLYDRFRERINKEQSQFKVYLVAHSMGGLICRCFLQNQIITLPDGPQGGINIAQARAMVDKVFTYATPHNGIDLKLIGNIPSFLGINNVDDFNRDRMRQYLSLPVDTGDVSSLAGKFDPNRFFCLVGTNHRDYRAAGGAAAQLVGHMSDGLVRIENATVRGPAVMGSKGDADIPGPRAFVHRSHSGNYGIVNSEEGFQNLTRFLFGGLRVDARLIVESLMLPPDIQKKHDQGKDIKASYHFEVILRVRGKQWDLHRRVLQEESTVFRTYDEILKPPAGTEPRHPFLFSGFLSASERINLKRKSLGFSIDLGIIVPEYQVDGVLFLDKHYAGGYLFRQKLNFEALPPEAAGGPWRLHCGKDSRTPNRSNTVVNLLAEVGGTNSRRSWRFEIPVEQNTRPGFRGRLRLDAIEWNILNE